MDSDQNDQLILICGLSSAGKSASLRNIRNQENWLYASTEAGKRLPMQNKFKTLKIVDPMQIFELFQYARDNDSVEGVIVDSLTFLMDMYESQYVLTATDTRAAWQDYQQYFKRIMQECVAPLGKPVIFTGHIQRIYDEKAMDFISSVPVKGALAKNGLEAYFSTIVYAKRADVNLDNLADMDPELCHITEDEEDLGYKHVFQTRPTKATVNEKIRGPMGLFNKKQTFIDNDAQLLLDHMNEFYKGI